MTARDQAWEKAKRLGFGASNWQPRWLCRVLGRHTNVLLFEPFTDPGEWSAVAKCCDGLHGSIYIT